MKNLAAILDGPQFVRLFDHCDTPIRPDGSVDVTPHNLGNEDHVAAVNDFKRRLRDGTPQPVWPATEGSEL